MFHGEFFCSVIVEQEVFDDEGVSQGIQPVNPHIIPLTRFGLRVMDRTECPPGDRPLGPNIECFYCTADTEAPFLAADADPAIGALWYEEVVDE